jgi:hypothetical protein
MAKAKSKSKKKKSGAKKTSVKKTKAEDINEVPVDTDAEDDMTAGEKFLLASKPYWAHIALAVLSIILVSVLWSTLSDMNTESASQPWRDLNTAMTQSSFSGGSDVSSLKEMAAENEGKAAANWALLMAGDREVNRGVGMLARDRVGGLKLINTGAESLQEVVDAPASSKSQMVQRRSTFMLAYAREAQGKFEEAKELYQSLLDSAPDSPYESVCRRGVARCSNTDLVAVYDQFRNWEEATDVAPGVLVPDAPELNIDEIKLPEGESNTFGGGDFGGGEMKEKDSAETEATDEKPADKTEEPAVEKEDPPAKKEEPAAETPAKAADKTAGETDVKSEVEKSGESTAVEADKPAAEAPATIEAPVETPATEPVTEPAGGGEGGLR